MDDDDVCRTRRRPGPVAQMPNSDCSSHRPKATICSGEGRDVSRRGIGRRASRVLRKCRNVDVRHARRCADWKPVERAPRTLVQRGGARLDFLRIDLPQQSHRRASSRSGSGIARVIDSILHSPVENRIAVRCRRPSGCADGPASIFPFPSNVGVASPPAIGPARRTGTEGSDDDPAVERPHAGERVRAPGRRVRIWSAREGSATPDGWLCAKITAAAFRASAVLATSRGWTGVCSSVPRTGSSATIRRCWPSRNRPTETSTLPGARASLGCSRTASCAAVASRVGLAPMPNGLDCGARSSRSDPWPTRPPRPHR